ncbi:MULTISPECIES: LysR family transcriptional regulator [unclassified Streptomyces]|uniref:LysR family transcriptional regulator n=1 Tax=unclassified Streptomyces TaxID=2593676 RepID=UPI000AF5CB9C|nr:MULTISPECIES: LysR family transcriptional regulator [unclassified Streptomyces]MCX5146740.1 LysR family transcriptional regulator [Streptomyces sp. NBC_00320]WSN49918.1 LysR family transcriptional regulator [Streptomyces sp. NBC_01296]WSW60666.1 LysR family transcriptional regulator [Streptomyces sp. NBC_00998]
MDLALLRTFVAVHRAGSFTRAAALLGLSQPAVTSQIRTLERQLGRPLFHRRARGVTPTAVGDELAHKAAPHLDALLRITEAEREAAGALRTLHLAGPPEFLCLRVLPALAPLVGQGHTLRTALQTGAEEALDGLAAGHHDLVVTTARPRGGLFSATALCDEEHVLVAAPYWAALVDPDRLRETGPAALDGIPLVEVHETLPLVARYWAAVFETRPGTRPDAATIVAPDLRAVLECVRAGAGLAVLPRYLCRDALDRGQIVALLEPPVPPLRTWFLVVRAGSLALAHLARAHDRLLRAAAHW